MHKISNTPLKASGVFLLLCLAFLLPSASAKLSTGYKHTSDYYAVAFDGEGDAIVTAQLSIYNNQEKDLGFLSLEIPGRITVYDVSQSFSQGYCEQWRYVQGAEPYCETWNSNRYERIGEDDLGEQALSDVTVLTITLPRAIQSGESASLFLTYKINRYAEKSLLGYAFDFKTIVDNKAGLIENVRVAVQVQEGLYLKGTGAKVDYKNDVSFASAQKSLMASEASLSDEQYQSYIASIPYVNGYVKTASYLDPGESFHVKGRYASNWFFAHLPSLLIIAGLSLIIFTGAISLIKLGAKRLKAYNAIHTIAAKQPMKEPAEGKKQFQQPIAGQHASRFMHPYLQAAIIGVASAVVLVLLYFTTLLVVNFFTRIGYRNSAGSIVIIFIVLCIFLLALAVLVVPPLYLAIKHGAVAGLISFVCMLAGLFILIVLLAFIAALFTGSPRPVPLFL